MIIKTVTSVLATAILSQTLINGHAATTHITIDTRHPGHIISPTLYGVFFEEINHSGDGGLYAEMVRNRTFKEIDKGKPVAWSMPAVAGASMDFDTSTPLNEANPTSLKLASTSTPAMVTNDGYWGMSLQKGHRYHLSFYARAASTSAVNVRLEAADGKVAASGTVSGIGAGWKRYSVDLKSNADVDHTRLAIAQQSTGSIWLNAVSLLPVDTFKGHCLRLDLAEKVAALKPAFIRFPGGCYVEGDRMVQNSFQWKKTLGDIAARPGHLNDVWGYYSTDGLGYHEYLQMCEDMRAAPMFVVNCGMAHHETVSMDQMHEYVQNALDAIAYANGPVTSKWGALRAKNGHPKPFNLKYVEIGNENGWAQEYPEHYKLIYDAIKSKYPNIITIADSNVPKQVEMVDDHFYNNPDWFWRNSGIYDNTDRTGPKHYVGEYAVTSDCGQGNLRAALGEAAFMTGLERNSDVVTLASYAPLFTNVNNRAWNPDAIPFDSSRSFGTPSYWVQEMFATNRPDRLLPVSIDNLPTEPANVGVGTIGLGTWRTSSEYKDIEVVKDGKTIYKSDFTSGTNGWKTVQGQWSVVEGAFRQSELGEREVTLLDSPELANLSDYTVHLKARKLEGDEGFLIVFRAKDDKNLYWYNIGGWGNTNDGMQRITDGTTEMLGNYVPNKIVANRWYDIRLDIHGARVQGYIDGKLVVESAQLPTPRLAVTSGKLDDGTVIVKAVNGVDAAVDSSIDLAGGSTTGYTGMATTLTSASPADENSLQTPDKIVPSAQNLSVDSPSFAYRFPAHSVTILRLKAK